MISGGRGVTEQCSRGEAKAPSRQPSETGGHTLGVVELDLEKDGRYNAFIASHPKAIIFHHPGWLSALQAEYETGAIVLGCENGDRHLEGVLPLLRTRGMPFNIGVQQTGRRLSSLPRTPLAGPIFTSEEVGRLLIKAGVDRAKGESGVQLQIKSQDRFSAEVSDGLFCTSWRPTYVLEVPERREELRFGDARNRHNLKWAVKKAEQNGISVRLAENESDLLAWYPLYLQVMRRNSVPPRCLRFFVAMWRNLASKGIMRLKLAEQKRADGQQLIAGSIFLTFGNTTWYAFTGIGDNDLNLHANDLILWRSIHDLCGTCVRWLDFGEVAEDHPELARFKTKWGALPKEQYRYYSGDPVTQNGHRSEARSVAMQLARRFWQRLPIRITQQLGDLFYSRL